MPVGKRRQSRSIAAASSSLSAKKTAFVSRIPSDDA